jgi:hypothetical protein
MAWSARARWVIYGIAALGTVAAMRWVDETSVPQEQVVAPAAPRPAAREAPDARSTARTAPDVKSGAPSEVRLDWLARAPMGDAKSDPFSDGPTDPPPATLRDTPPPPPPAPQAPPLPFSYVGKWTEDGRTIVFLARGGNNVAVRGPGKLDDAYAVESIDDKQMVMKYLPLGKPQVLSLVAPTATQPAAQVATAPDESSEGTEEESN